MPECSTPTNFTGKLPGSDDSDPILPLKATNISVPISSSNFIFAPSRKDGNRPWQMSFLQATFYFTAPPMAYDLVHSASAKELAKALRINCLDIEMQMQIAPACAAGVHAIEAVAADAAHRRLLHHVFAGLQNRRHFAAGMHSHAAPAARNAGKRRIDKSAAVKLRRPEIEL